MTQDAIIAKLATALITYRNAFGQQVACLTKHEINKDFGPMVKADKLARKALANIPGHTSTSSKRTVSPQHNFDNVPKDTTPEEDSECGNHRGER